MRNRAVADVTTYAWRRRRASTATVPGPAVCSSLAGEYPEFAVEHEEGLLIGEMPVHWAAVAALSVMVQECKPPRCGVAASTDANKRAHEPHRLLDLRREDHWTDRGAGIVLSHDPPSTRGRSLLHDGR